MPPKARGQILVKTQRLLLLHTMNVESTTMNCENNNLDKASKPSSFGERKKFWLKFH